MNKEEEKENLYNILLNRNCWNQMMIRKFLKKITTSKKGFPSQSSLRPLIFPTLNTVSENSKDEKEKA